MTAHDTLSGDGQSRTSRDTFSDDTASLSSVLTPTSYTETLNILTPPAYEDSVAGNPHPPLLSFQVLHDHEPTYPDEDEDYPARPPAYNSNEAFPAHVHNETRPRCALFPNRAAAWLVDPYGVHISGLAASVLLERRVLQASQLKAIAALSLEVRTNEIHEPTDPITGVLLAAADTVGSVILGVSEGPAEAYRQIQLRKCTNCPTPAGSKASEQVAIAAGKGVLGIVGAGLSAPATYTYGLAKGFHNAPRLYGDDVRDVGPITDARSGIIAAGKGFGCGLYDGLTGFVTQPIQGAKKEGGVGFLKGFGKGIGGLICKPAAGACALPGYAFMGVYKDIRKVIDGTSNSGAPLAEAEEWRELSEKEQMDLVDRWHLILHEVTFGL